MIPLDWKNAPVWAKYWAADTDGTAWWYEVRPQEGESTWKSRGGYISYWGEVTRDNYLFGNWRGMIRERPVMVNGERCE